MGADHSGDIPEHYNPIGKGQTLAQWRKRMRMPVLNRQNVIVDLIIVRIYEVTAVNGRPLDLLIEARKTKDDPSIQFGVIFSKLPPSRHDYGIPILWREEDRAGLGRWV